MDAKFKIVSSNKCNNIRGSDLAGEVSFSSSISLVDAHIDTLEDLTKSSPFSVFDGPLQIFFSKGCT
jgi:hypothetical protein